MKLHYKLLPQRSINTRLRLVMLMIEQTPRASPGLACFPLLRFSRCLLLFWRTALSTTPLRLAIFGRAFEASPALVPSCHGHTSFYTCITKRYTAVFTDNSPMSRRQHQPTIITGSRRLPRLRAPHTQPMSKQGLLTRPLQKYTQIAKKALMPRILMALEQPVRLLEPKKIKGESPQRGRLANLLVENARVGRSQNTIRAICKLAYCIGNGVARALEPQSVG
jgi:hypothetical protein